MTIARKTSIGLILLGPLVFGVWVRNIFKAAHEAALYSSLKSVAVAIQIYSDQLQLPTPRNREWEELDEPTLKLLSNCLGGYKLFDGVSFKDGIPLDRDKRPIKISIRQAQNANEIELRVSVESEQAKIVILFVQE